MASDDPGLLQNAPQNTVLLPQNGGEREQAAEAGPTGAVLAAMADLSVSQEPAECP